jgi:hypothetical protein
MSFTGKILDDEALNLKIKFLGPSLSCTGHVVQIPGKPSNYVQLINKATDDAGYK